jgi:hypothetical protein
LRGEEFKFFKKNLKLDIRVKNTIVVTTKVDQKNTRGKVRFKHKSTLLLGIWSEPTCKINLMDGQGVQF